MVRRAWQGARGAVTDQAIVRVAPSVVLVGGRGWRSGIPQDQHKHHDCERGDCTESDPLGLVHVVGRGYSTRSGISTGTVFGAQKPLALTQ